MQFYTRHCLYGNQLFILKDFILSLTKYSLQIGHWFFRSIGAPAVLYFTVVVYRCYACLYFDEVF